MSDPGAAFLWEKKNRESMSGDLSKHGIKTRPPRKGVWSRLQKVVYSFLCGDEEEEGTKYFPVDTYGSEDWEEEENEDWDVSETGKDVTKES
jgi:hypothetical protein